MGREDGLTLIELVVVAVLLAVLSGILYGTLTGIMRARDSTDAVRSVDQSAHHVLSRITMELNSRGFAPLNSRTDDPQQQDAPRAPSAPAYFLGTDQKSGAHERDSIRFVSASAAQPLLGAPSNFGLTEVEYRLAENPDIPSIGDHPVLTLVRQEEPAATSSPDISKKRRVVLPLAENVVSLNFRYLKGGKWQNDWKESNPLYPDAVEISLELLRPDGKTELYRTAVPKPFR